MVGRQGAAGHSTNLSACRADSNRHDRCSPASIRPSGLATRSVTTVSELLRTYTDARGRLERPTSRRKPGALSCSPDCIRPSMPGGKDRQDRSAALPRLSAGVNRTPDLPLGSGRATCSPACIRQCILLSGDKDDETPGAPLVPESACEVGSRTPRVIPLVEL